METEATSVDVAVIGAGPGGYAAAVHAARHGFRVALIEERAALGGTCLNVGCIPSKALLESSEHFAQASHGLADHGVLVESVRLDLARMMQRKERVVGTLTAGLAQMVGANRVTAITGRAAFISPSEVQVSTPGQPPRTVRADRWIVATGSAPASLPALPFDGKSIVDSTGALAFDAVPARLVVVGGGAIGLEMASIWARLGAAVTVVELMPQILPGWDTQVAQALQRILEKQRIRILTSAGVTEAKVAGGAVSVAVKAGAETQTIEAEKVLVAVGRRPYTAGLGLDKAGVQVNARGFIETTEGYRTTAANIYAIGDVIGAPMLAHKAEAEGAALAERLSGKPGLVNYTAIPGVVYTAPEVASVGRTEETLKAEGIAYRPGVFWFKASGRAHAAGRTDGFAKVLSEAGSDRILGVHILGAGASELIAEAVSAMEFGGSAEDVGRTIHAHPTLSETLMEAARAAWHAKS